MVLIGKVLEFLCCFLGKGLVAKFGNTSSSLRKKGRELSCNPKMDYKLQDHFFSLHSFFTCFWTCPYICAVNEEVQDHILFVIYVIEECFELQKVLFRGMCHILYWINPHSFSFFWSKMKCPIKK